MEHTTTFDVNSALRRWLDSLAQSPQFRPADLAELESHVRDSVVQLETKGLSSEESFLIATRRVGTMEKLEPEFGKVNRSPKLILIHLVILAFFSAACWFLWGLLKVAQMSQTSTSGAWQPRFTMFLIECRPLMIVPPLLAAAYCLWFALRRNHGRSSWVGFFACTAGVVMLLMFPVIVAVVLPLIAGLNQLSGK